MQNTTIEICKTDVVDLDKVRNVHDNMPSGDNIIRMADIFKVLGDATRLKIVLALTREELCVCDLTSLFDISVSAISHQLRLLKAMRIVKYRKAGKMVYYSLDDDHVKNLIREANKHIRE